MEKSISVFLVLTFLVGAIGLSVDIAKHEGEVEKPQHGKEDDYEDIIGLPSEAKSSKDSKASQEKAKQAKAAKDSSIWMLSHREPVVDVNGLEARKSVKATWAEAAERAEKHLGHMKLEHKLAILQGRQGGMGFTGYIEVPTKESIPKLKKFQALPPKHSKDMTPSEREKRQQLEEDAKGAVLRMNDAGQGFHGPANSSTQFPGLLHLAASFDRVAVRKYAAAVAQEFVDKGANVLLGPCIDLARVPLSGRAFETLSGEDPFLGSALAAPYVETVQDRGIMVTLKHFLNNNQEESRHSTDVKVSDKAQYELYLPAFKAAIEAGAGGVMCSYNKVDGQHACESKKLLKDYLRRDLDFKGFVISDWGAVYDAKRSAHNGLDIEMKGNVNPSWKFNELKSLVKSGQVKEEQIDDMVRHILTPMYAVGHFDGKFPDHFGRHFDVRRDHAKVAKEAIIDGAVLLKNSGNVLPLSKNTKTIAFIGKHCDMVEDPDFRHSHSNGVTMGGGSGWVRTDRIVTPFQGMRDAMSGSAVVKHSIDSSAAAGVDVAVVCAAAHAGEGWDRADLMLEHAKELVEQVRNQGARKVVMLGIAPGVITTEWIDNVDAALLVFMPGEQVGPAVADLITGVASPGGRLPVSLPRVGEMRFEEKQYPGIRAGADYDLFSEYNRLQSLAKSRGEKAHRELHEASTPLSQTYSEDTLVGYRWNDAMNKPAAFPFGFGLTYTNFDFKDLKVTQEAAESATVTFQVTNTGQRSGHAVPQLYVGFPSLAPVKRQLRGFEKIVVAPGVTRRVTFKLGPDDWKYYDQAAGAWKDAMLKGDKITINIGHSSASLPLEASLQASQELVEKAKAEAPPSLLQEAQPQTWLSTKKQREELMFKQSLQLLYMDQEKKLHRADKRKKLSKEVKKA